MRRNSIGLIWALGILATGAVYEIGPDRFVYDLAYAVNHLGETLDALAEQLIYGAFDLMRALALGLFGVFVVLCFVANRQGLRSLRALVVVSVLFLGLIGAFGVGQDVSISRHWLGAFVLAAVAAAVMTRRLMSPRSAAPPVTSGWMAR